MTILNALRRLLQRLEALLDKEQFVLFSGYVQALTAIAEEKQKILLRLQSLVSPTLHAGFYKDWKRLQSKHADNAAALSQMKARLDTEIQHKRAVIAAMGKFRGSYTSREIRPSFSKMS